MQSQQESIVRKLTERSMGASYVFEPADYRKGSATREHADLVWSSNGTVLLVSMKAGRSKVADKNRAALAQLAGGLRAWRELDIPLEEVAEGQSVRRVPYQSGVRIALLSVVSDEAAPVTTFQDLARRKEVEVVASIPQIVFERLADMHGSSRDLYELLFAARHDDLSADEAFDFLRQNASTAWNTSPLGMNPAYRFSRVFNYLAQSLLAGRLHVSDTRPAPRSASSDLMASLDDLGWNGLYAVLGSVFNPAANIRRELWLPRPDATQLKHGVERTVQLLRSSGAEFVTVGTIPKVFPDAAHEWPPPFEDSLTEIQVERHTFLVARVRWLDSPLLRTKWASRWREAAAHSSEGFPPIGLISWQSPMGVSYIFAGEHGTRESETEALLRRFRPDAPPAVQSPGT